MKSFLLPLLAFSSIALAGEESLPKMEPVYSKTEPNLKHVEMPRPSLSEKGYYMKIGICSLWGNFSLGRRVRDQDISARDHSFNIYFPFGSYIPFPSYKYSVIKYLPNSTKYTGIGFEGILGFIPNIELIYGTERVEKGKVRWTQLGINMLPLAVSTLLLVKSYGEPMIVFMAAICATGIIHYSWAF